MGTLTIAFAVFCLCVWATPAEKSKPTPIAAWLGVMCGDRHRVPLLARVYRGAVGMVIPAANPSAWHHSCAGTNQGEKVPHVWRDSDPSHWCCPHGCVSFQSPGSSALWGHEWALVAWLAENEKRKAVLWEYLDGPVETLAAALCVEDELDTLPEDAMQFVYDVNLPDPNECRCRWSGSTHEQREQNRSTALCPIHT